MGSLMQHQQSTGCAKSGRGVNPRLDNGKTYKYKFFHGTSWECAKIIRREGFRPSSDGRLGRGIYVAREDKATRFANRKDSENPALVEVLVTIHNPKYVEYDDDTWQREGYDACRAECTSSSNNPEWCIRKPNQIEVVRIRRV